MTLFIVLSWVHMLFLTWPFLRSALPDAGADFATFFHGLTWIAYSFLYLLPAIALCAPARWLLPQSPRLLATIAILATTFCLLFIRADRLIYDLYNFHFNGFVANLLFTPGGVESLGGGTDTYVGIAGIVLRMLVLQCVLYALSRYAADRFALLRAGRLAVLAFVLLLTQSVLFGVSDLRNEGNILLAVKTYPFYQRVTFRNLVLKLGYEFPRKIELSASPVKGNLRYPLQPIVYGKVERPPNIMLLVSESMRWDRLAPDIMPNTWAFAQRAQHFTQHYSSGNGTREGLFGMFYGLYGSYWQSFLHDNRPPLLMQRLQELNYQFDLRTSARFSYPEFNRTLFAGMPKELQQEGLSGVIPWQNDLRHTDGLLQFLAHRDPNRPFMSLLFFDATHARYTFPETSIVKRPYLENLNYAELSKESLEPKIDQLLNRYANSAHSIDVQIGRVLTYLEQNGLLENTIVIVTGDHGEEFMERGFWGHNSSFVEYQTHTPMVVWKPGMAPAKIDRLSNHVDIATTLLQELGAPADAHDYSLGRNLFDDSERPFIVVSDWHSIGVRTADMNYRIPYLNSGVNSWEPMTHEDLPYSEEEASRVLAANRSSVLAAIANCSRFYAKAK
jgi:membrane-anchored protein YejM (alkaline phosphatase superfamily)